MLSGGKAKRVGGWLDLIVTETDWREVTGERFRSCAIQRGRRKEGTIGRQATQAQVGERPAIVMDVKSLTPLKYVHISVVANWTTQRGPCGEDRLG